MSEQRGELQLIEYLRRCAGADPGRVPIGIGDDMAAVRVGGDLVCITSDMLLDGVHFETSKHSWEQIGRKALACSLSDCAAMACRPVAATVSVALCASMSMADAEALFRAITRTGADFGCAIAGGDTTSWDQPLAIDVTMLGAPATPRGPVTRDGARIGDRIYVTGKLGGSIAGHHLSFMPRIEEGVRLASALGDDLHAMMDISDGLALDLYRVCQASGVGAELDAAAVESVVSDAARQLSAAGGPSALEHTLHDGEDFELLFVVTPSAAPPDVGVACTPVGQIVERGLSLQRSDHARRPLEPRGYEHFR
jgi:thiamine-monophosphate kinase